MSWRKNDKDMKYGSYVRIGSKENNLEGVAVIAENMAMIIREIGKDKPGSIVEKAEIIIKENTIGWKVEILEPGEEEQRRKKLNVKIMDGAPLREEERKDLVGVLQDQKEKNKIDLGEIIGLSEEDAEPLRKMVNR